MPPIKIDVDIPKPPIGDPVIPIKPVKPVIDQCKEMEKMTGRGKDYRGA
jgi:hypothetical protein